MFFLKKKICDFSTFDATTDASRTYWKLAEKGRQNIRTNKLHRLIFKSITREKLAMRIELLPVHKNIPLLDIRKILILFSRPSSTRINNLTEATVQKKTRSARWCNTLSHFDNSLKDTAGGNLSNIFHLNRLPVEVATAFEKKKGIPSSTRASGNWSYSLSRTTDLGWSRKRKSDQLANQKQATIYKRKLHFPNHHRASKYHRKCKTRQIIIEVNQLLPTVNFYKHNIMELKSITITDLNNYKENNEPLYWGANRIYGSLSRSTGEIPNAIGLMGQSQAVAKLESFWSKYDPQMVSKFGYLEHLETKRDTR